MNRLTGITANPLLIALVLIAALLFLGDALSPGFASGSQILRLLIVAALLGIVAAGQNLVILGGREGIDLSVGGVVSLSAIVAGNVMNGMDGGIPLAILACVATGALFGLFNQCVSEDFPGQVFCHAAHFFQSLIYRHGTNGHR